MTQELQKLLRPMRRKLTRQRAMPRVATAMLIGGWLALVAALLTLFGGSMTSGLIGIAVAVAFPVLALAWSMWRPASWKEAAQLVDRRLQLHNRTSTALQLAGETISDPFAAMQVEDALTHLRQAKLASLAITLPWRRLASGAMLTLFSVALIAWGILAPPSASIQTSGDMQDIRPEVNERIAIDIGPIDTETLARSAEVSRMISAGNEHFYKDSPTTIEAEAVSGRYFDSRQANSER